VSQPDIEATLNQGVGMVLLLPSAEVATARATLAGFGIDSWVAGEAVGVEGDGTVRMVGQHA
jgi:phosphoribosylformylglycinamidine cyclo-ligase